MNGRGRVASSRTMPGFRRLTAVMAACVASLLRSVGASYVLHEEGTTSVVYTPEMCHPTYLATDTLTDYSAATPYGGRFQRGICDTAGNIYSARYAANDSSCSTPLFMTFLGRSPVPIPGNTTAGTQPYVLTCVQSNLVTFRYRRSPGLNCASTCGEQYDQIGICLPVNAISRMIIRNGSTLTMNYFSGRNCSAVLFPGPVYTLGCAATTSSYAYCPVYPAPPGGYGNGTYYTTTETTILPPTTLPPFPPPPPIQPTPPTHPITGVPTAPPTAAPTPAPNTAQPTATPRVFSYESGIGTCRTNVPGTCFTVSRSAYCLMDVLRSVILNVTRWTNPNSADTLSIRNMGPSPGPSQVYRGGYGANGGGPHGVIVPQGYRMEWHRSSSGYSAFTICGTLYTGPPVSAHPTPVPTRSTTVTPSVAAAPITSSPTASRSPTAAPSPLGSYAPTMSAAPTAMWRPTTVAPTFAPFMPAAPTATSPSSWSPTIAAPFLGTATPSVSTAPTTMPPSLSGSPTTAPPILSATPTTSPISPNPAPHTVGGTATPSMSAAPTTIPPNQSGSPTTAAPHSSSVAPTSTLSAEPVQAPTVSPSPARSAVGGSTSGGGDGSTATGAAAGVAVLVCVVAAATIVWKRRQVAVKRAHVRSSVSGASSSNARPGASVVTNPTYAQSDGAVSATVSDVGNSEFDIAV
eukprot:m.51727 g.51727  ORF g.51727 m.51727 type:complete len:689 (-) comp16466_c0_seq1:226-2292(-)